MRGKRNNQRSRIVQPPRRKSFADTRPRLQPAGAARPAPGRPTAIRQGAAPDGTSVPAQQPHSAAASDAVRRQRQTKRPGKVRGGHPLNRRDLVRVFRAGIQAPSTAAGPARLPAQQSVVVRRSVDSGGPGLIHLDRHHQSARALPNRGDYASAPCRHDQHHDAGSGG